MSEKSGTVRVILTLVDVESSEKIVGAEYFRLGQGMIPGSDTLRKAWDDLDELIAEYTGVSFKEMI